MNDKIKLNSNKKFSLQEDFNKTFSPFIIYLATLIILLSFFKDLARVGFNAYWLIIRVGYLPFIIIVWEISKKYFKNKYYETPLWAAALYITSFCTFFSFSTGGLRSDYIFGLLQLYFAIALMPITTLTFFATTFFSLAIYIGLNICKFGFVSLPDNPTSSTLVPLIVFSIIVYLINSKIRQEKLALQNELFLTIKQRDIVIQKQTKELIAIETRGALGLLAAQVAHDIRSPLAVLSMLMNQQLSIPEETKILLRNVVNRIRDIANGLIEKNREQNNNIVSIKDYSTQLLPGIIYPLLTEKRVQFRSKTHISIELELSSEDYELFVNINLLEFKRMLSNIINNSVEAFSNKGKILIKFSHDKNNIRLVVTDNGKGIPIDILNQLGGRGVSYDKKNGSGLGLYHAKNVMNQCGGKIEFFSEVNQGTKIVLNFPKATTPRWFLPVIEISNKTILVILDDEISIHQLWQERFKNHIHNLRIINFTNSLDFEDWQKGYDNELPVLYLFDLELGNCKETGLDLIEKYKLYDTSIIVTSHFEDTNIHSKCEKLGLKMIPKDLAGFVPIKTNFLYESQTNCSD